MHTYEITFVHNLYQSVVRWNKNVSIITDDVQLKVFKHQYRCCGFSIYKIDDVRKELTIKAKDELEAQLIAISIFNETYGSVCPMWSMLIPHRTTPLKNWRP